MNSIELYQKIMRLARNKGLSVPQLYKKAGISDGTLRSWKKNNSCPSLYVLEGLCYALDISLSRLFSEENTDGFAAEQREVLELWDTMSKEQKDSVCMLIKAFKKN